ncbi:hypothetical protein Tco_0487142 [Tanacetum coccineum]
MSPERSKAVVLPKFDMHVITSDLTSDELKTAVVSMLFLRICIPIFLPQGDSVRDPLYKPGGRARKCFKEVTASLKGWKKKFFMKDRRAIPNAMPWRHGDTNLHDDFSANYDETDVARISEFLQRPQPRVTPPLPVGTKLPELTAAQKNLEKPDTKVAAAREKKERQNLAKEEAKRAGADAGGAGGSRKKQKIQKKDDSVQSWSEGTLSVTPRQAIPEIVKTDVVATPEVAKVVLDVEKVVVNLSGCSTPLVEVNQPSPPRQHDNTQVSSHLDAHSQSSPHGHGDESLVDNFGDVQSLELDRLRSSLQRMTQDNNELNKRLILLDGAHSECPSREKELSDRVKDLERERDEWRSTASDQAEADRKKLVREFIPAVVKRLHASVEYRKSLAEPVQLCFTAGWLGGLSLGRTEDEIAFLSETKDRDIEGSKSWEAKHLELFAMSYPYVQKVAASYDLPMSELLKVSPDVPAPLNTESNPKETVENASQQPLHSTSKTTTDLDAAI